MISFVSGATVICLCVGCDPKVIGHRSGAEEALGQEAEEGTRKLSGIALMREVAMGEMPRNPMGAVAQEP